ncbi:MAG: toxic anion resistance protein, partial [Halomonadaceae bacterium]|nr:toxic anion resistance protein [Halomonadaceae bacterium]
AHQGDEGGPVAQALSDLRERMQELDPHQQRLSTGPFDRLFARFPGAGSRVQRYFRKFENAQEALNAIIADLEGGRDMLRRDNITLGDDQESLRSLLVQLERQVNLGRLIDRRLVAAAERLAPEQPQRTFIEEELLFPLRQRIIDLQQQQAVSQQGVLALEVIIRNNRELMRGVDRAIHVTVSALTVAVAVALALANQRLVLDRVESLNATTSAMIGGTARALRQQGVEIQSRASSAQLDMQTLEEAFDEVLGAIDDLSRYRQEALPRLDAQIDRLAQLARQGGTSIERLQQGNAIQARPEPDEKRTARDD